MILGLNVTQTIHFLGNHPSVTFKPKIIQTLFFENSNSHKLNIGEVNKFQNKL